MPIATLKQVTEKLGISLDDPVYYSIRDQKGIIEIKLTATDPDIESAAMHDISEEFLTEEELIYFQSLDDK